MQVYKVLNPNGHSGHSYGTELSLSPSAAMGLIADGALLQNVTPTPTAWQRDPNGFHTEPNDQDACNASCKDGAAHVASVYSVLILTVSATELKKRSYWSAQALAYAENESQHEVEGVAREQCKLDCYEGWLRGAVGYCKAVGLSLDPTKEDLYILALS